MQVNSDRRPRRLPYPGILPAALLLFLPGVGSASDDEELWLQEIPTITSATRMFQRHIEAPHTITVIDRDMIEASGAIDIAELFRLVPGMQIGQGDTANYSVTYHGQADSYSRRIQVMVDGRPVYGPAYNSVDWHALGIDIDDIRHIEVMRGPSGATYGENAFTAAINIITLQPFETAGWHVKAAAGSLDRRKGFLRYGGNHQTLDYRVGFGFDQATAFEGRNTEKIVRTADLRLLATPEPGQQIELHAGLSDGPMGRGSGTLADSGPADPYQSRDIHRNYQLLRWLNKLASGGELRLQFYHSYFAENDRFVIGRLSDILGITSDDVPLVLPVASDEFIDFGLFNYKSDRLDAEIQYSSPQYDSLRYVAGFGGRLDTFSSDYLIGLKGNEESERLLRGFINLEYLPAADIILNGGVMIEHGELASTEVSPRLSLNYLWSRNQALRASVSRSVRAPSLLEENFDIAIRLNDGTVLDAIQMSNPSSVDAENIIAFEFGYSGDWKKYGLLFDIKLFKEILRNEILNFDRVIPAAISSPVIPPNDKLRVGGNGGRIDTHGAELQVIYRTENNFLSAFQYAYANVDEMHLPTTTRLSPLNLDGTPQHTASLLLSKSFGNGWSASTLISYQDEMLWFGDGGGVDEHTRVDLRLSKKFRAGSSDGRLEFIVHNIGETYELFDSDQFFETRYYVRGALQFN